VWNVLRRLQGLFSRFYNVVSSSHRCDSERASKCAARAKGYKAPVQQTATT